MSNNINLTEYILERTSGKFNELNLILRSLQNKDFDLFEIVSELPSDDIKSNKLYLMYSDVGDNGNYFDVFVYVNGKWEQLDSLNFNLSNYYTSLQIDNLLGAKASSSQLQLTKNDLTALYNNLTDFNQQLSIFGTDNEALSTDLSTLKTNLEGFINKVNEARNNITSLNNSMSTVQSNISTAREDITDLKTTINGDDTTTPPKIGLKEDLEDTKDSLQLTKNGLNTARVDITNLQSTSETFNTKLNSFDNDLQSTQTLITGLQASDIELIEELERVSSTANETSESLTQTNNTLTDLQKALTGDDTTTPPTIGLRQEFEESQVVFNSLSETVDGLSETMDEFDTQLNGFDNQIDTLSDRLDGTDESIGLLQSKNTELTTGLGELTTGLNGLDTRLTTTETQLTGFTGELNDFDDRLDTFDENLSTLDKDINGDETTTPKTVGLKEGLESLSTELVNLGGSLTNTSTGLTNLRNIVVGTDGNSGLRQELVTTNTTLNNLSVELNGDSTANPPVRGLTDDIDSLLISVNGTGNNDGLLNSVQSLGVNLQELWNELTEESGEIINVQQQIANFGGELNKFLNDLNILGGALEEFEGNYDTFQKENPQLAEQLQTINFSSNITKLFASIGAVKGDITLIDTTVHGNPNDPNDNGLVGGLNTLNNDFYGEGNAVVTCTDEWLEYTIDVTDFSQDGGLKFIIYPNNTIQIKDITSSNDIIRNNDFQEGLQEWEVNNTDDILLKGTDNKYLEITTSNDEPRIISQKNLDLTFTRQISFYARTKEGTESDGRIIVLVGANGLLGLMDNVHTNINNTQEDITIVNKYAKTVNDRVDTITNDDGTGLLDETVTQINGDGTEENKGLINNFNTLVDDVIGDTSKAGTILYNVDDSQTRITATETILNGDGEDNKGVVYNLGKLSNDMEDTQVILTGDPTDENDNGLRGKVTDLTDSVDEVKTLTQENLGYIQDVKKILYGENTTYYPTPNEWTEYTIDTSEITGNDLYLKFIVYPVQNIVLKNITNITNGNFQEGLQEWIVNDEENITSTTYYGDNVCRFNSTRDTLVLTKEHLDLENINEIKFNVKTTSVSEDTGVTGIFVYIGEEVNDTGVLESIRDYYTQISQFHDNLTDLNSEVATTKENITGLQDTMYGGEGYSVDNPNPNTDNLAKQLNETGVIAGNAQTQAQNTNAKIETITNTNGTGILDNAVNDINDSKTHINTFNYQINGGIYEELEVTSSVNQYGVDVSELQGELLLSIFSEEESVIQVHSDSIETIDTNTDIDNVFPNFYFYDDLTHWETIGDVTASDEVLTLNNTGEGLVGVHRIIDFTEITTLVYSYMCQEDVPCKLYITIGDEGLIRTVDNHQEKLIEFDNQIDTIDTDITDLQDTMYGGEGYSISNPNPNTNNLANRIQTANSSLTQAEANIDTAIGRINSAEANIDIVNGKLSKITNGENGSLDLLETSLQGLEIEVNTTKDTLASVKQIVEGDPNDETDGLIGEIRGITNDGGTGSLDIVQSDIQTINNRIGDDTTPNTLKYDIKSANTQITTVLNQIGEDTNSNTDGTIWGKINSLLTGTDSAELKLYGKIGGSPSDYTNDSIWGRLVSLDSRISQAQNTANMIGGATGVQTTNGNIIDTIDRGGTLQEQVATLLTLYNNLLNCIIVDTVEEMESLNVTYADYCYVRETGKYYEYAYYVKYFDSNGNEVEPQGGEPILILDDEVEKNKEKLGGNKLYD